MTIEEWLKKTPEKELFHYTTPEGLIGISTSGKLWATVIHHLNDETEFTHALGIFNYEIFQATEKNEAEKCSVAGSIGHALKDSLEKVSKMFVAVASFSEHGDLLSQWRGYCPRGGFSLGFTPTTLTSLATVNKFQLSKCIYDPNVQHEVAHDIVLRCLESYRGASRVEGADIPKIREGYCGFLMGEFVRCAPLFKSHSFWEEAEWRLVAGAPLNDSRLRVRATATSLVPYLEFDLTKPSGRVELQTLIIGPSNNSALAMQAATMFRFAYATKVNLIASRPSKVPLRIG